MGSHGVSAVIATLAAVTLLSGGCVTKRKYNELARENKNLRKQFEIARDENARLLAEGESLRGQVSDAQQLARQAAEKAAEKAAEVEDIAGAEVGEREGLTVITVSNEILFASGKAEISSGGKGVLGKVADLLKTKYTDGAIRVEGHTDNQPIRKTKDLYKSNWELSVARSLAVVHFLVDECGIDAKRVHPAGYSMYHPLASNSTAPGRARNRRVEIVILQGLSR